MDGQHHNVYLRDTDPECMYELYELYIFNVTYIFQPAAYSTTHISTHSWREQHRLSELDTSQRSTHSRQAQHRVNEHNTI